jgi:hypothetical protein
VPLVNRGREGRPAFARVVLHLPSSVPVHGLRRRSRFSTKIPMPPAPKRSRPRRPGTNAQHHDGETTYTHDLDNPGHLSSSTPTQSIYRHTSGIRHADPAPFGCPEPARPPADRSLGPTVAALCPARGTAARSEPEPDLRLDCQWRDPLPASFRALDCHQPAGTPALAGRRTAGVVTGSLPVVFVLPPSPILAGQIGVENGAMLPSAQPALPLAGRGTRSA